MSLDITARKHRLDVGEKFRVDRHDIFEMPMRSTVLHHPDFAIAFDNLGLDLANLFIDQNRDILFATKNVLARLNYAVRTQRVRDSRPTECRLRFLPGLK